MAPYQSYWITALEVVNEYSIDHSREKFSGNDMKGLKGAFTSSEKSFGFFGAHKNSSFTRDAKNFLKAFQNSKGSSQKLIDDFVENMRTNYGINVTVN